MGIRNVIVTGIYTDQRVSSTVRSLADESFYVFVVEDCCGAGTDELHRNELEIIDMIYCHMFSSAELRTIMGWTNLHRCERLTSCNNTMIRLIDNMETRPD